MNTVQSTLKIGNERLITIRNGKFVMKTMEVHWFILTDRSFTCRQCVDSTRVRVEFDDGVRNREMNEEKWQKPAMCDGRTKISWKSSAKIRTGLKLPGKQSENQHKGEKMKPQSCQVTKIYHTSRMDERSPERNSWKKPSRSDVKSTVDGLRQNVDGELAVLRANRWKLWNTLGACARPRYRVANSLFHRVVDNPERISVDWCCCWNRPEDCWQGHYKTLMRPGVMSWQNTSICHCMRKYTGNEIP